MAGMVVHIDRAIAGDDGMTRHNKSFLLPLPLPRRCSASFLLSSKGRRTSVGRFFVIKLDNGLHTSAPNGRKF